MNGSAPFALVAASTLAQLFAGWTAVLPIAALAIYGWFRGGFLATIAGLQVVGAFLAAVALAQPLSGVVESLGCPATQSLAMAYLLVFAVAIGGIQLTVGAVIPEGSLKLAPLVDHGCGLVLGAGAGLVLGGALLVGWSMADMPAWFRLDNTHQPLESGGRVLATFARFAARDAAARTLLLDGDRPAPAGDAGGIRASEPFVDVNRSGICEAGAAADAESEPYLDIDSSGGFTRELIWQAVGADGRRRAGLRDCYRLAEWRRVRSMHAPRIESAAAAEVIENTPAEEVVYQARAVDVDGDGITFALEQVAREEDAEHDAAEPAPGPGVAIDRATGVVTLVKPPDFERAKIHEFVVVATDSTGLSARKRVRLRVRDVPLEPSASR